MKPPNASALQNKTTMPTQRPSLKLLGIMALCGLVTYIATVMVLMQLGIRASNNYDHYTNNLFLLLGPAIFAFLTPAIFSRLRNK